MVRQVVHDWQVAEAQLCNEGSSRAKGQNHEAPIQEGEAYQEAVLMAGTQDYLNALRSAIKKRDKKTTTALLKPYLKRGGKVEDLYNLKYRRKK